MKNEAFWWYILLEAQEKQAPVLDSLVELSGSIGAEYAEGADVVRVRAYYRSSHDLGHWLKELNQVLAPWPDIVVRDMGKIANRSWHTAWKEAFPPLPVGEGLVVMAPWHKGNEPEGRLPLYIYPGSSFGTGYHESTQIALELLEKHLSPGDELVDVGCGSGILSIGAIKLGASRAWARDFDPAVVEEVLENCRLNDISQEPFRRGGRSASGLFPEDLLSYGEHRYRSLASASSPDFRGTSSSGKSRLFRARGEGEGDFYGGLGETGIPDKRFHHQGRLVGSSRRVPVRPEFFLVL